MGDESVIKQQQDVYNWKLFRWGLIGLGCTFVLIYIFFVAVSIQYYERNYTIWGRLGPIFLECLPCLIGAGIGFAVGFAFRGKERKDIAILLSEKSDHEKLLLLGLIWKSMEEKPQAFLPGLGKIKDIQL
jgi:hypothetical protein